MYVPDLVTFAKTKLTIKQHCPETQLDRVTRGVAGEWSGDTLNQALDELAAKRAA